MIARLLIALGLVVVSAVAGAQTPRDPGQYFFNETLAIFAKSWPMHAQRARKAS